MLTREFKRETGSNRTILGNGLSASLCLPDLPYTWMDIGNACDIFYKSSIALYLAAYQGLLFYSLLVRHLLSPVGY